MTSPLRTHRQKTTETILLRQLMRSIFSIYNYLTIERSKTKRFLEPRFESKTQTL